MKTAVYNVKGEKSKEIELPKLFSEKIREDIIAKVIETQKVKQPYSPSLLAGNQHVAGGNLQHRRHVWKSQYGRGMSRIPRKTMSKSGSQFNWVGAMAPNTRGGRRAHPPRVEAMINTKKINKKELKIAMISALAATANSNSVSSRYERLKEFKIKELPIVVESKITSEKTKQIIQSLKKILGERLFEVALKDKSIRKGMGKLRGRKYKSNAGMLLIVGEKEKIKASAFDVRSANSVGVSDIANGGVGRLVVYTENAVKELGEKLGGKK